MRVGIFDLEMTGLNADFGIILCCCIKDYHSPKIYTLRADKYPSWKKNRVDDSAIMKDIIDKISEFDILIAHNGQYFDKGWLNAKAIKFGYFPWAEHKKFIDPCLIARRKFKIHSNSLRSVIAFLGVKTHKTDVDGEVWLSAYMNGDKKSLDYIVDHCVKDVKALEEVYDKMRTLIDKIDKRGSA